MQALMSAMDGEQFYRCAPALFDEGSVAEGRFQ